MASMVSLGMLTNYRRMEKHGLTLGRQWPDLQTYDLLKGEKVIGTVNFSGGAAKYVVDGQVYYSLKSADQWIGKTLRGE